jgi:alanine racemase
MPDAFSPVLTVDLGAILANYRLLAGRAAPAQCGVAMKADAYGLGAAMIAPPSQARGLHPFLRGDGG